MTLAFAGPTLIAHAQTEPTSTSPPPGVVDGPVAEPPAPASSATIGLLPSDLSPWGMFVSADIVVKCVIGGLALASVLTWTVGLVKTLELAMARRRLRQGLRKLSNSHSLDEAAERLRSDRGATALVVAAAVREWHESADVLADRDGLKERVASHFGRIEAGAARRMSVGTGLLATIGSTTPFVGLFGTVWGIMNSFIGISRLHTTNLAVVAPGIAEALLATAAGLVTAIPAVVIYNHFARRITATKGMMADSTAAVHRLVSRDLSRCVAAPRPVAG